MVEMSQKCVKGGENRLKCVKSKYKEALKCPFSNNNDPWHHEVWVSSTPSRGSPPQGQKMGKEGEN